MKGVGSTNKGHHDMTLSSYLPIYEKIPEFDFSIDEIVQFAMVRSRFHEELRAINEITDFNEESKKKDYIKRLFSKHFVPLTKAINTLPLNNTNVPQNILNSYKQEEIDINEFYSLLLISLRNEDLQRSFVQGECAIFRYRLFIQDSIKMSDLPKQLFQHSNIDFESYLNNNEFKIPFEYIFPYINVTKCKLKDGFVTLVPNEMIEIFVSFYKIYLERSIAHLKQQEINQTEIFKVIATMFDEQTGAFFSQERTNWNVVSLDDIDSVAHRSFPPCMYNMYKKLKTSHKLFYTGRLQLGLFLKGIGLSLNDSLKLWRDEFSKFGISLDQFDRQYAYNIRYNYGKEGSCRNFSPYSCMGMIRMPAPAIGQTHGCPFIQMRKDDCKVILEGMFRDSKKNKGVAFRDKCEALAEKGQNHPQIACTQLFNELHDHPYEDSAVRHPCEYFSFSEEQFKEIENSKK